MGEGIRKFATDRGLGYESAKELRALTPALLTGPNGGDADVAEGRLADGLEGTLAHHSFADGRTRRHSTVVVSSVPETVAFVPALVCRDRAELGEADIAQLPAERWQRAEFESVEFNCRYQLFTLVGQDQAFMYELFSPALLSWLCTEVPPGFGFELNSGHLSVFLPAHLEDRSELDRLCSLAGSLTARIRAEAIEEGPDDAQLFREESEQRDLAAAIGAISWKDPPPSVGAAIDAYRAVAARRPWVLLAALVWAVLAAAVVGALGAFVVGPVAGVGAGIVVLVIAFGLARAIASIRYRFGSVPMQRVGLEAFIREYARSRSLELEDRWAFHSRMRKLPMPGVADHVLAGRLFGSGLEGRFVMFGDAPELRSAGQEIAFTTDRPLAANALLVRLAGERRADLAASLAPLPEHYQVAVADRDLLVWRPIPGNLIRTAEGSDAFCAKAGEVAKRAGEGSPVAGAA